MSIFPLFVLLTADNSTSYGLPPLGGGDVELSYPLSIGAEGLISDEAGSFSGRFANERM